ncbi:NAD-dependent epimerase/dehydratase family protein [Shewanella seohaensis]|uniref:NAD-dependent epimerase/dehydratase family protein n=1 Tax=Shewanella seohaensis TaxID=755175 RepID=UPI0035B80D31
MNNYIITGKSGFIGSHFVAPSSLDLRAEFSINDLIGTDSIIHLAGLAHSKYTIEEYIDVNVNLTLRLAGLAAKAGVKRFVYLSSINVQNSNLLKEPAVYSKLCAEQGLIEIAESTGLELVIVRSPLVYGKRAPGNFKKLVALVKYSPFLPFLITHNKRDFIAVENLVDLLITCTIQPNAANHTLSASDGEAVSIKQFTDAIAKGLNKKLFQIPVPVSLMKLVACLVGKNEICNQLLGNLQVAPPKAQEVLGWIPPYTMEQAMSSLSENKK